MGMGWLVHRHVWKRSTSSKLKVAGPKPAGSRIISGIYLILKIGWGNAGGNSRQDDRNGLRRGLRVTTIPKLDATCVVKRTRIGPPNSGFIRFGIRPLDVRTRAYHSDNNLRSLVAHDAAVFG